MASSIAYTARCISASTMSFLHMVGTVKRPFALRTTCTISLTWVLDMMSWKTCLGTPPSRWIFVFQCCG
ncbi:unnamed protein product [Durusdinium trenchii]|uniref:Secreted protein n=2 Tax=Durusdinium trenchii TaxID=1381693 RepID=A0ABP0PUD4_9DINO